MLIYLLNPPTTIKLSYPPPKNHLHHQPQTQQHIPLISPLLFLPERNKNHYYISPITLFLTNKPSLHQNNSIKLKKPTKTFSSSLKPLKSTKTHQALALCFRMHFVKDSNTTSTAAATVRQLVSAIFDRVVVEDEVNQPGWLGGWLV